MIVTELCLIQTHSTVCEQTDQIPQPDMSDI